MSFKYTDFTPIDGILVQPGPVFKYKVEQTELEETKSPNITLGKKKREDLLDAKVAKPIKKITELNSVLRVGQVLAIGNTTAATIPFEVGDWIVYNVKTTAMFELLYTGDPETCPVILPRYNVISKVSKESVNVFINSNKIENEISKEVSEETVS
jgi:hypothetical protein